MTDHKMTYRERRLRRADRLEGWAEGRAAKADAAAAKAEEMAGMIPFGQPILVGHHSEGRAIRDAKRIQSGFKRSAEHADMADRHASKAANIRAAVDRAIYDDDPDVVERLAEKLAGLEAQREQVKAANAAYRKEHRAEMKGMTAYQKDQVLPFPAYVGQNLSGNISRTRKRLEAARRREATR